MLIIVIISKILYVEVWKAFAKNGNKEVEKAFS